MELYSVLVTGANRGIGLEFVRQLVRLPKPPRFIFATYRSESSLQALKDIQSSSENSEVILVKADVTNASDLKIARDLIAEKVGENGLTLLISNAAANKVLKFPNLTEENLQLHFIVNAVGPILLFQISTYSWRRVFSDITLVGEHPNVWRCSRKNMEVESVLITGANRGIGLELVRQIIQVPNPPRFVFATYRSEDSAQTLKELQKSSTTSEVVLIKLDVTKPGDLKAARSAVAEKVGENGLTLLINNAGVAKALPFPQITEENLLTHFNTNTVGPIMVLQEMLPLLQKAAARKPSSNMAVSRAAVLNISSMVGSITRTSVEFRQDLAVPGYKISKAALNMSMRVIAGNIKEQGILVVMMCPGWVKTDMGSDHAQITPEESIGAILKTLPRLDDSHHGTYMDRFGNAYPF